MVRTSLVGGLVLDVQAPLDPLRDTRKGDTDHLLLAACALARKLDAELLDLLAWGLRLDSGLLALDGRLNLRLEAKLD